jgi:hypothetical protein
MERTMNRTLVTLARWLANKSVREEWNAAGRKVQYIDPGELTSATELYLRLHKARLLREAWEHPVAVRHRTQDRMRMARKAVIAEIRHNGRKVNSIAPEELGRLIGEYLKEHPEEMVGYTDLGCFPGVQKS